MKKKHLLIIRFSSLGDVAMLVPVVYSLSQQYPNVIITVLSRSCARSFFYDLAPNVNFMEANLKEEYGGVRGLNTLYRRLTAKRFTHIADMHGVLRSNYLRLRFNLNAADVQHINKHKEGKRQLTSKTRKILCQQPTVFDNYAEVLKKLGFPVTLRFTSLFPEEGGNLNLLPKAIGPKKNSQPWIGVAPFAAHLQKIYPLPLMKEVIRLLRKDEKTSNARFFLFGRGEKETNIFRSWLPDIPHSVIVPDILDTIYKELILMSHLDVMISMDSANMHLASISGARVVSVWGSTHPYAGFYGWNQRNEDCVQADLPCRPCSIYGNKKCFRGDLACMNSISPLTIADKVFFVIKERYKL